MKKLDDKLKAAADKENLDYEDIKEFFQEDGQGQHKKEVNLSLTLIIKIF